VEYIRDKLTQVKELLDFNADFRVVSLSSLFWSPSSYPVVHSSQRIPYTEDQSIQKWNVEVMESYLLRGSVKGSNWFVNIMGDAEYMVWMPPYWRPSSSSEDELHMFSNMFMEPTHERGKIYLWDPSTVKESVISIPWMCSLNVPESGREITALED